MGFESGEGTGSTFWFELPISVAARPGGGPKVLIVEDELGAAELLRAYLAEGDYEFQIVTSGENAVRAARELRPDVVCLDMTLSGDLDGFDVLAELKADPSTAGIPVVVCTAGNGRGRAAALGAADFLSKPFDAPTLRRTVDRVLPHGLGSVLVVDDDATVRALVTETLGGNGLELREAADGREAVEMIDARRPDAIVLDLLMPGMDGFEVLERLQASTETRLIPVIVLTGHRLSGEERETLRRGTVSLLEKSDYSRAELRALIDRAVG
jgi:CheY-like chemotaxis protein